MDIPLPLKIGKGVAYSQIRGQIQDLVSSGKLPPGTRLPPVRTLAQQLKVNRLTVLRAYHELEAMGYLSLEVGCGTFVPETIPDAFVGARKSSGKVAPAPSPAILDPLIARMAKRLDARMAVSRGWLIKAPSNYRFGFESALGDFRLFPMTTWRRLYIRHLRRPEKDVMRYIFPMGYRALREAICRRILPARGIQADPDDVMIIPGSAYGTHLCIQTLLAPGDRIAFEEPHYYPAREQARMAGARIVSLPVDDKGVRIDALRSLLARRPPQAIFLTPSHQYPTTVTLDYGRRVALMQEVAKHPLWVFEDDYDHEFHYDSPPMPSLKSMDTTGQILYFGTFSKSLFPSLRIGFLIAPRKVLDRLWLLRILMDHHVPSLSQLVLADFINDGHYDVHIRRLRRAYQKRRDLMSELLRKELPDFSFTRPAGGMRLWVRLPKGLDGDAVSERLLRRGIVMRTGRVNFLTPPKAHYLHLGFAAPDESEIREGIKALKTAVAAERR